MSRSAMRMWAFPDGLPECFDLEWVEMDSDIPMTVPEFECFPEYANPPAIIPGRSDRRWMDETSQRFAYRCTPLSIANASGWEILLPGSFIATWDGGADPADIVIKPQDGGPALGPVVSSVFGHGVLTFHPGYLFRTSPGWAIITRGPPNTVKDGIVSLEGLVETDWLPFPFTMNWRFTRPGTVRFEAGEGFCFLSLTPHAILDQIQPRLGSFTETPKLKQAYDHWRNERKAFQARIAEGDPEALKQGWQRDYVQGKEKSGHFPPDFHLSKRQMKPLKPS